MTDSAEWRVITDVNGKDYGNWFKPDEFGEYKIPVVENKQGGVLIEPIEK